MDINLISITIFSGSKFQYLFYKFWKFCIFSKFRCFFWIFGLKTLKKRNFERNCIYYYKKVVKWDTSPNQTNSVNKTYSIHDWIPEKFKQCVCNWQPNCKKLHRTLFHMCCDYSHDIQWVFFTVFWINFTPENYCIYTYKQFNRYHFMATCLWM